MKELIFGGNKIVMGRDSIKNIRNLAAHRAFIVTGGKSMFESGVIANIQKLLNGTGCQTLVYSGIKKNPDTGDVIGGLNKMREFKPDLLIAVGGGSPMDAAKVMALMYENPEINFDNVLTVSLPEKRNQLKFVAIPSTSGTGSEVTRAAVITFHESQIKIGIKTLAFIPDVAILDSDLTMTMPDNIVAETGMDAMTHAVECYINPNLDDFAECMAKGAVEGLFRYLPISYQNKTRESREKVHHYQCIAGIAFDNVGLGMAHGISHAIGGMFNLGHGLTNAIVLPYILEYNTQDETVKAKLSQLARYINQPDFITAIRNLNEILNIPCSFEAAGISQQSFRENIDVLVQNSLKGATRVNPVKVTGKEIKDILTAIYYGKETNYGAVE